jgi:ankyrin repeat protein
MPTVSKTGFLEAVKNHRAADVTSMLRERPEFVSLKDPKGRQPLQLCARRQVTTPDEARAGVATARALVNAGADVNAVLEIEDDGEMFPATALWHALALGRNRPLAAYLLKLKADPNHCMFALVFNDDLTSAKLLRRHGADIDEVGQGETPLIYALRHQRVAFAQWLLKEGANPNFKDRRGFTPMHHAVRRRLPDSLLRMLIQQGADVAAVATDGVSIGQLATRAQKHILGLDQRPVAHS